MAISLHPPLIRERRPSPGGPRRVARLALRVTLPCGAAATAGAAGVAWTVARLTGTPARARTVALAALVGAQLGQTLVIGHRSPLVLGSGVVSVGACSSG